MQEYRQKSSQKYFSVNAEQFIIIKLFNEKWPIQKRKEMQENL